MSPINRELIAQLIIALAVCVGAWYFLVRPKVTELNTIRSAIAQHQMNGSGSQSDPLVALAQRAVTLRSRIEQIQQQNALTHDTSDLYATVQSLAEKHNIEIIQLQPGADAGRRDAESLVTRREIRMSVLGSYENVAAFLEHFNDARVFIVPVSLTVSPVQRDDQPLVQVNLTCEALQFSVERVLEKLKGAANARS